MTNSDLIRFFSDVDSSPHFTARPIPIPGDSRIAWRLALLCILIRRGRANRLALEHLHVLWWAARSHEARETVVRRLGGNAEPDEFVVRYDPSLAVTLDLAIGQGLVTVAPSGLFELSTAGVSFADETMQLQGEFTTERSFVERLPRNLTQAQMKTLLELS